MIMTKAATITPIVRRLEGDAGGGCGDDIMGWISWFEGRGLLFVMVDEVCVGAGDVKGWGMKESGGGGTVTASLNGFVKG
jgi:hypothetical protein